MKQKPRILQTLRSMTLGRSFGSSAARAALALLACGTSASAITENLTPTDDASIWHRNGASEATYNGANSGALDHLETYHFDGNLQAFSYLKFDLSTLPAGAIISDVTLTFTKVTNTAGPQTGSDRNDTLVAGRFACFGLYDTTGNTPQDWSETTITFNSTGNELTDTSIASETFTFSDDAGRSISFDGLEVISGGNTIVTIADTTSFLPFVLDRQANGGLVTFMIKNPDLTAGRGMAFGSSESANPPILQVEYTVPGGDSDLDGLLDTWELTYFPLVSTYDGSDDADTDTGAFGGTVIGDGYTNLEEFLAGSNPLDPLSTPIDIDGDGLLDAWEIANFGSIATWTGTDDPDFDGYDNEEEESAVPYPSDPDNFDSIPDDADGDFLSDTWEDTNFGSNTLYVGYQDPDGDCYSNEEEETAGTDPLDLESFPAGSDGDNLNDLWEIQVWGDTTTSNGGATDSDGDGDSDYDEYVGGSDPTDPASIVGDIDGDGLDDQGFELIYWDSVWDYDGDDDPDGDFATNAEEDAAFTDPTFRGSAPDFDDGGFGDFLGDAWEIFSFGDTTSQFGTTAATADPDGDGFDNETEFLAGTNGNDPIDTPDTDGDGLGQGYEISIWGDTTTHTSVDDDSDGGGVIDIHEFYAGTNPDNGGDDGTLAALSTAIGNGADTYLTNDAQSGATGPDDVHGGEDNVRARLWQGVRINIPYLRFDVSKLEGDLDNLMLRTEVSWSTGTRTIQVYGLRDGLDADDWDENTLNYDNAPGIDKIERQAFTFYNPDGNRVHLGSFVVPNGYTGALYTNPDECNLRKLVEDDTDGLITLILVAETQTHDFRTKEFDPALAPALVAPLGSVILPSDPKIDSITHNGSTVTVVASGLPTSGTTRLLRGPTPDNITTEVDAIANPAETDTFTDSGPLPGEAYYQIDVP